MTRKLSPPVRLLQELANLLSKASLYPPGHPAREETFEALCQAFAALREPGTPALFSFVDGEVIYGSQPLTELKNWPWSHRLAELGIGRLELDPQADAPELRSFVQRLLDRLGIEEATTELAPHPHIRFGAVEVRAGGKQNEKGLHAPSLELSEEAEAIQWIHEQVESSDTVPMAEAGAVVRGLLVAVRGSQQVVAPLLHIKSTDQYTSAHCINTSILSMSLAEYLQFTEREVHAIGEAALLHDIGKTKIPLDVLQKPGQLTQSEREIIERHPVEGARLLLGSPGGGREADVLTAVVAYEHHMHWAGEGGYPKRHYSRKPHRFSRLVQVCDVYDALSTRRPFRAPFTPEAAVEFLGQRAGSEFDPDFVRAFQEMMQSWDPSTLEREEEAPDEAPPIELDQLSELPAGSYDADTEAELYAL